MTIAITAASGQLGHLVIEKLKARVPASGIIALARRPEKAADLGVTVREADFSRPETLAPALAGVDKLLFISSGEAGPGRIAQHRNMVEAAKRAGVKHIVYTSLLHADTSTLGLAEEHRATEAMIRASRIPYTFLRNSWYTENYTASVGGVLAGGALIGSAGEGRISSAPRADYAEAAVAVLTGQGHEGETYELAGDEAYTLADLAVEISRQTGRTIPFKNLPEADYAAALAGFGLPEGFAKAIANYDVQASQGALFNGSRTLSRLIDRPTTPLSAAVAEALNAAQ
jgi:NAD(P)H dehydrogenase (quinone)